MDNLKDAQTQKERSDRGPGRALAALCGALVALLALPTYAEDVSERGEDAPARQEGASARAEDAAPGAEEVEGERRPTRALQPGDRVGVSVPTGEGFETQKVVIDLEGYIALESYERVAIGGRTEAGATRRVREALGDEIKLTEGIRVRLVEPGKMVMVSGYVERPGPYRLSQRGGARAAIQAAGGATDGADFSRVMIQRGTRSVPVDLHAEMTGGRPPGDELRAGDTLFVPAQKGQSSVQTSQRALMTHPAARDKYFILGAVARPGVYPAMEGVGLVAALALAGGTSEGADRSAIRILTRTSSTTVDLQELLEGGEDRSLSAGSIVFVPRPPDKSAYRGSNRLSIVGQVNAPGLFVAPKPVTLDRALALAGGPREKADLEEIIIVRRRDGVTMSQHVDLGRAMETAGLALQIEVGAGDVVMVDVDRPDGWKKVLRTISDVAVLASAFSLLLAL
jgi:protein involved in polysaccharide export with SLBB domain